MLATVISGAVLGIEAYRVEVEVDLGRGMMIFSTVGLAMGAVCEARTRVKSALENSGYAFPQRRVTVNLAPAHIKKVGTAFDLPIALGILVADQKIPADALADTLVVGELSLDGRVRGVRGVLPIAAQARRIGVRRIIVPAENVAEATAVEGVEVVPVENLAMLVAGLCGAAPLPSRIGMPADAQLTRPDELDLADVRGQAMARRALEVCASGSHNILLIGSPGAGKTLILRRMGGILPPLGLEERLECSTIASIAGLLRPEEPLMRNRPFRAPHHTVSDVALIGGGSNARPGEVALAHNGVLFLDEMPEFRRNALEALRQPIEDGEVVVARAEYRLTYPARAMLAASMNPCPCGYYGHPRQPCACNPTAIRAYRNRISGPLLDRIDVQVCVDPVEPATLRNAPPGEPSAVVRTRVVAARERQTERFRGTPVRSNAQMRPKDLLRFCKLDPDSSRLLETAIERLGLSARAHDRVLKVARTIADLEGTKNIGTGHVAEAIQYRQLDRETL